MSRSEQLLAGLTPPQRELVLRRLAAQAPRPAPQRIPRRAPETPAPLSFAQERMWFLERLDPGRAAYNLFNGLRLRGPLDARCLARCLDELVARHEVLRSVLREEQGRLVQVPALPPHVALPCDDLRQYPASEREARLRALAQAEWQRPFDLAQGPLLRARLLLLDVDEHALFVTLHHAVADGWSYAVLVREMVTLYGALAAGLPSPLPPLPLQYADFAAWQRGPQAAQLDEQVAWWQEQLRAPLPQLALPTDRTRASAPGFRAAALARPLSLALRERLLALGREQRTTLFMTLGAAFAVLLQRHAGVDELALGCPIAGRNRVELEGLIGCFLNTLVLRVDLRGDPTFVELLERLRQVTLQAFAHQDAPLERVLGARAPEAAGAPFQAMFLVQNFPAADLHFAGLQASLLHLDASLDLGLAGHDVTLAVDELADGLGLSLTYNAHLFDETSVARLLAHFEALLFGLTEDPRRALSAYALCTADERRALAAASLGEPLGAPAEPVHVGFERQAARRPEALALLHDGQDERLTYGELNRRANRLARRLRASGARQKAPVALLLPRSADLVVALLAALKCGAAYLPLDPGTPEERLDFMLRDARAGALVTTEALRARVRSSPCPVVVAGEAPERPLESGADANLDLPVAGDSLAYVIYTSGSSGRPKGVLVRHAALAAYADFARVEFGLGPGERVLQFASPSFDTSAEEIYPTLTAGAALVLRSDEMLRGAQVFLERCAAHGVTLLDLPTAYWHELVARAVEQGLALPACLRLVIVGGEKLQAESLAAWSGLAAGRVALVNTYGPTETTIVASLWPAPAEPWPAAREAPIGRSVRGARVAVLDARLEACAFDVPGELCIGGVGLARGYLGRPDLTAEKFIPSPFEADAPGARLYRSGDRARLRADGTLEFLGRLDRQVKLRGFRIELGEIEQALLAQSEVAEAAVITREDAPGQALLVAYVVPRATAGEAWHDALRRGLAARLPEFMQPARYVTLDALPRNAAGKLDRRALPEPPRDAADPESFAAPSSPLEERLAQIWARVLGLPRVGVHDNFFRLGGHSLLLPQILYHVQQAFGVHVPLRALVDEPTVAELALCVEELLLDQLEARAGAEPARG